MISNDIKGIKILYIISLLHTFILHIYVSQNYNKLSACISNLLERILFQVCAITLKISFLMKYNNFWLFITMGKKYVKRMDILNYSQVSPSRMKILAGIKWTNFWNSKVEKRENKTNKILLYSQILGTTPNHNKMTHFFITI